jgi:eukaryotic-like serine/threonine-protein kinase
MNQSSLDHNVLFGLLALQVDLINGDQFVTAVAKWAVEKARSLGEILVDQGALTAKLHDAVEPMVAAHVERHGGDPARSLASLSSTEQVRGALHRVAAAVPELQAGLSHLGATTLGIGAENEATTDVVGHQAPSGRPTGAPAGRFRVLRPHARGGLGQVYVARDNELGRQVALKEILADKAANPELRARFVLEAEINGNLEHPGIVPVYGLGTYPDGRPFYAMRFIEGDSLKEAIERFHRARSGDTTLKRPFDSLQFRQLLRRYVDVCNAIAYAHSRGVLHRDLKPANVMLGQYGETLIIDWGLAKATGRADPDISDSTAQALVPASGSSIEQTEAGTALGTPAYMSPEQAGGRIKELGPASDGYGLGATLFAVLTGQPPVDSGDLGEILRRVQSGAIDRPRSLVPGVPRPLEAICLKALALRPEERYPRAKALADDVERWLADEPVSALREPWTDRLRRWGRRNRTLVATAATAALFALAGLGIVAVVQAQSRRQLSIKNEQLTSANLARGLALDKANARVDLALEALEQYRETVDANLDVQNRPENVPLRNELLQTPLAFFRTLRDDLRDDPAARPEDRLKLADAQLELARLTRDIGNQASALEAAGEAVATLEVIGADSRATALPGQAQQKLLGALELQAALQTDNGRSDLARKTLDRGVKLGDSLVSAAADIERRLGLARLLTQSASADADAERINAALATLKRAQSLLEGDNATPGQRRTLLQLKVRLLDQTAVVQAGSGKPKDAIETLNAAILLLGPLTEGPNPDWDSRGLLSETRLQVGTNHLALGQAAEALEDCQAALEVRRAMLKERPANLANRLSAVACLRRIAQIQGDQGRGESSLENLREALGLLESARVENPRNVRVLSSLSTQLGGIGAALYKLGRLEESLATFEQRVPIHEELVQIEPRVTANRADLAGNLYNIATLRRALGKFEASLDADSKALVIRRQMAAEFPDKPFYRFQVAASLGNVGAGLMVGKHDSAAALAYYREASSLLAELALAYPDVAQYSEYLARTRTNLASILVRLGRFNAALAVDQAAEHYLERRVRAQGKLVQARIDFAFNLYEQAESCLWLRRYEDADRLGSRALETLLAIPETGRRDPEVVHLLVFTFEYLGMTAARRDRFEEALGQYNRSISTAQPDPTVLPAEGLVRGALRKVLEGRAEVNARLGRSDAARSDWSRLVAIKEPDESDMSSLGPILIRAWSGEAAGFVVDAEAAVAAGAVKKYQLVTLARAACVAIATVRSNSSLTDRLGADAVAWILAARDDGVFASEGAWKDLIDPRFDPIARLPKFRDLKSDLTFPAQPFASETTAQ